MIPESKDGNKTWLEKPKLRPIEAIPITSQGRPMVCLRDPGRLVMGTIVLPQAAAVIISFFNGHNDLRDIQAAILKAYGQLVEVDIIRRLATDLDQYYFLEGETFDRFLLKEISDFKALTARPALFAGLSYAADPDQLARELAAFEQQAVTDQAHQPQCLQGLVVPHIDFPRGGRCYASGYHMLDAGDPPGLVVILGTAHTPTRHQLTLCPKDFETPFGPALVDRDLADELMETLGPAISEDDFVHRGEHSVEFQAVWLLDKYRDQTLPRILPFLCGSFHGFIDKDISPESDPGYDAGLRVLKDLLARWSAVNGRVLILASADLSHVGPKFGDTAAITEWSAQEVRSYDLDLMDKAAQGDAAGFFQKAARNRDRTNVCGLSPIYTLLKLLDEPQGRLIHYDQWRDEEGQEMVTFASLCYPG